MGSLFQLTYQLRLRERGLEKAMIDELRCLNGNLKISLGMTPQGRETLFRSSGHSARCFPASVLAAR